MMRPIFKATVFLFVCVLFSSCYASSPNPTSTAIPTQTNSLTPTIIITPVPTRTIAPKSPISTALLRTPTFPNSLAHTKLEIGNRLTWIECEVPNEDYSLSGNDMQFLKKCVMPPVWDDETDGKMVGEQFENPQKYMELRIRIGEDFYETKMADIEQRACCHYELLKNGTVITNVSTKFFAHDPNLQFWNIEGKLVWELEGWEPLIVVDGVNYNEEYKLQGSYKPYEIKGKLIYIAKQNENYQLIYDGEPIGPEFDQISMPNCCAMIRLYRGSGQYWFVGAREGKKFVVSIQ